MSSIQKKNTTLIRNAPMERTYDTFPTETWYSPLPTRIDRVAYAPIDEPTKKRLKNTRSSMGTVLAMAGEHVDPGDVHFNKQTPTNANYNTTMSAVAAGFKNAPLPYKAPVSG